MQTLQAGVSSAGTIFLDHYSHLSCGVLLHSAFVFILPHFHALQECVICHNGYFLFHRLAFMV